VAEQIDPGELRVSNLDRERAGELLAGAMQQGRLTPLEYSERCAEAWSARTRAELRAVLSDLPGGPPPELQPLVLDVPFGQVRRTGPWAVPDLISIRGLGQRTTLDFTTATIRPPVVRIEVTATMSATRVLLPTDVVVDADGLELVAGSVRHRGPKGAVEAARALELELRRTPPPPPPPVRSRGVGGIRGPGWARREEPKPGALRRLLGVGATPPPPGPPLRFELHGRATLCSVTLYYQRPGRLRLRRS
jgi:hypothetical protein